ncbi:Glycine--tRNA ligase beta subunit [uncultured Gammaproteobacteria bacterium]
MAEFLLELFSEDIPARMQVRAAEDLKRLITARLSAAGLEFTTAEAHSTPRRLALVIEGLPQRQPTVRDERKGPRDGSPEPAIRGFLKSAGLTSLDQCEKRDSGKGVFWFAVIEKPGRDTADLLPSIITQTIAEFPWPKSMRWADNSLRWVRPLHSILALFDGKTLDGALTLGNIATPLRVEGNVCLAPEFEARVLRFSDRTRGHRFLAPDEFSVTSFAHYKEKLRTAGVMLDRDERKARIKTDAIALAGAEGLAVAPDDGLLEEVAGLVEWPVVRMGVIDDQFMAVPAEVLITSMRTHQKYFATLKPDGSLAPRFVVVANMLTNDGGAAVVAGNQRVLRARLSDARFFWDQDRKEPLRARLSSLKAITFHAKLGTVFDKVTRIEALAGGIATAMRTCDGALARHVAILSKTDLVTGMVGEFPELQGIMGRYYALAEGEPAEVADAIAEHYKPLGPNDSCPTSPLAVAVSLADKVDSLAGFFAIDEKPTGSKDPYALRRAALGAIRLIVENGLRLDLISLFEAACELYRVPGLLPGDVVAVSLLDFFADRLKVVLREQGVRHDLIDAVFATGGADGEKEGDLIRLLARVEALQSFLGTDDGANLLTAYRRACNILRIEEKNDGCAYTEVPERALLTEAEEVALAHALDEVESHAAERLVADDFAGCMAQLAKLRAPVDAFFERVTVNADRAAVRANRLCLLSAIRDTLHQVADFSRIEG